MQIVVAWNAIPVMVGFKHDGRAPPIPDRLLDDLSVKIGEVTMKMMFDGQATDPELREVHQALVQTARQFIVFWTVAFEQFDARRYFADHQTLTAMLSALIENPEHGLEEMFGVDEDDDRNELSSALATAIVQSYGRVGQPVSESLSKGT